MIKPIEKTNKPNNNLQTKQNEIQIYHTPKNHNNSEFDNMLNTEIQKLNNQQERK